MRHVLLELLTSFLFKPNVIHIPNPPMAVASVSVPPREEPTLKEAVLAMADDYGVPRETVDNLIECESRWDPTADNGADRGLWQINRRWHPTVTDEVAFNPLEASKWGLQRIKDGYLHEWVCANCVAYIRAYFYPDLPPMDQIVPNSYAFEGSVVIFDYDGVKHLAYLDRFEEDYFVVKEANYEPAKIAERNVPYNDPRIVGFYAP